MKAWQILVGVALCCLAPGGVQARSSAPWIDISAAVEEGKTPVYPGDPALHFTWAKSLDRGDIVNLSELHFGAHTGTHIDAPLHFIAHGESIDQISLDKLIGPALIVDCGEDVTLVDAAELNRHHWQGAKRILFKTRNSYRHLYDDATFHTDFVGVAPDAAKLMAANGVVLVGIDYNSIEQFGASQPLTHRTLLGQGIVIVEGLDLRDMIEGRYDLIILPARFTGREAAPARAVVRQHLSPMNLPLQPPVEPMLAALSRTLPEGDAWLYEPKWDGFRTLVFWDGDDLLLQSRDLKPLGRYFPELEEGLRAVLPVGCILDGEIVIVGPEGLDFDALLLRIHPAASRVRKLAAETPSCLVVFDLLCARGEDVSTHPLSQRRQRLEALLGTRRPPVYLTPATTDAALAREWFDRFEGAGLDGVVSKDARQPYAPGQRTMVKVKHQRTADCVVGGFRWLRGHEGKAVGSLLLGLYDQAGVLHHVGHTSSFKAAEKQALVALLEPYRDPTGMASYGAGRAPGGPSRWRSEADQQWESLRPELVCEVAFDHLQGNRFRHASTFQRWRPDKPPAACDYAQLKAAVPYEVAEIFK